jgi:hypothetical protein
VRQKARFSGDNRVITGLLSVITEHFSFVAMITTVLYHDNKPVIIDNNSVIVTTKGCCHDNRVERISGDEKRTQSTRLRTHTHASMYYPKNGSRSGIPDNSSIVQ